MTTCPFHQPLLDLDNFTHGTPREAIADLRRQHRMLWQDDALNGGHWLVLHKADIETLLRDPATFSSSFGPLLEDFPPELLEMQRQAMTFMDPPRHRSRRALVDYAFRKDVLDARKPMMQAKVAEIIDGIIDRGECEFVSEVAMHLPVHVIFTLLGIQKSDYDFLVRAINTMTLANDPDYAGDRAEGFAASASLVAWAAQFAAKRRKAPGDDLTSELLRAEVDGRQLSDEEFAVVFQGIIIGGTETTRNTLSWLIYELIQHPGQLARLQADPALVPAAVEEILRYRNTVVYTRRTAMRDVAFAGENIRQGDKMICLLASVNRDPEVFERPDEFDISRDPDLTRRNMRTFGFGVHACLGQHQARLNLEMMMQEILSRMDSFRLLAEPVHFRSNFMDGFKQLRIGFERR
ncbi:cytochrome P450 [Parahaliea aestuarii]|uniref:Cytochrome P450 n=1 Tax=Parahaliea aestuarii TaxID=1852021 RepID=A0A5C8ZKU6_9GAMM|nr:cytochrome P450 [Parahaliea aestuarii]TXS89206.1 cytochrome P450 [Parahaliea aestuarii]